MISPLCCPLLKQIDDAFGKNKRRILHIDSANNFTDSPAGMEKLDGICMLFIAIGEALKHIDKMTEGHLNPCQLGIQLGPTRNWKLACHARQHTLRLNCRAKVFTVLLRRASCGQVELVVRQILHKFSLPYC